MKHKIWFVLSFLLIVSLALVGCAADPIVEEPPVVEEPVVEEPVVEEPVVEEPEEEVERFTIGISNPFISSEYRTQMIDNLITVNEEYMAMGLTNELVIESFDTDVAGQIEQLENLINAGVDAILVNPGDAVALNQILEEAVEMGILVLSIDQEIEAEGVINVGHDQYEWARISAQWFAENLQEGDVVLIEGFIGHPANELRMSAVYDVFENFPGINVLASESGFWDQATGQGVMSDYLAAYPNLDGYWTQDGMALGALEAVIAADPDPRPLGTGEGRVNFLRLWGQMLEQDPDFETIAVANAPGVNATALRIAVEILSGNELNTAVLGGQYGTTIVIDVPIVVTPENFAEVYEEYVASGDYPDSYLLDGIMTQDEVVNAFFSPIVEEPVVEEPFRIGFVYVGVPVDFGWTYEHDQGRLAVEEEFGDAVYTSYVEAVTVADSERVFRDFAQQGYDMVFGNSFGYMDPMYEVATEFPDILFEHCSGFTTRENMATYFGRIYQPRFLSGIVAGAMTETNQIGYVAAFPIPEVIRGINAFTLGVRSVNPDATVSVVWTNTWFDPVVEREAAMALLDQGVDVIAQHQDTTEPQKAAQEVGAMGIGYNSDQRAFVGDSVLTSPVWNWDVYYIQTIGAALDGTWETHEFWGSLADGVVGLADFSPLVPDDVVEMVEEAKAGIIAGDDVFCGPIFDQAGELRVEEGVCLTDGEMLSIDWFVQGVLGEIN